MLNRVCKNETGALHTLKGVHDYNSLSTGIPIIVLLTKIDLLGEYMKTDINNVYRSTEVYDVVQILSDKIGIDTCHIMPVKNYEKESTVETGIDILAMAAVREMLRRADDFLEEEMGRRRLTPGSNPDL